MYTLVILNMSKGKRVAIEVPSENIAKYLMQKISMRYFGRPDISCGRGADMLWVEGSIYPTHRWIDEKNTFVRIKEVA